jgi:uncharacterized protein (TIGR02145 family)
MKKFTLLLVLLYAIISLKAQDYLISFAGTGASTTVDSVKVENLTQGKSLSLSGLEVLRLSRTYTGINPMLESKDALRIYPNPTIGNSTIDFMASASGAANIELFDITGKRLFKAQNTLTIGTHSYQLSDLKTGIYTVRISSQAYNYIGKLVSNGAPNSGVKISYLGYSAIPVTAKTLKSASAEKIMQYTTGDRLMIIGVSGNYSTVVIEVPTLSKTITFSFAACTDADYNNYPVVQIGTQVWMVENLKTTKYRDGSPTPNVTDNTEWGNLTTGAYCNYNNDAAIGNKYGKLYNWYAANSNKNLAPTGWHIPTDAEWATMEKYLIASGYNYDGTTTNNMLAKALAAITDWPISTGTGTPGNRLTKNNLSGLTALPGGFRDYDGTYQDIGGSGNWWSSTELDTGYAWDRAVNKNFRNMFSFWVHKSCGYSVRCVRDESQLAALPTITTVTQSAITSTTALSGGNITSDGGAVITARGLCWATTVNPTTANNKTNDGTGAGSFVSSITDMSIGTLYYVRSYAINSAGTAYGNQISFTTNACITVTDIDGNVYPTVTIGSQVWMAENLRTTKYRDGSPIPNVTDDIVWGQINPGGNLYGAYCNYSNDVAYGTKYGKLYNWSAVNDSRKIAPTGWHVPTDAEWTLLTNYLSAKPDNSGSVAKALASYTEWAPYNESGAVGNDLTKNNTTGFTALPAGYREYIKYNESFSQIGYSGFWWSSSEYDSINAWIRALDYLRSYVYRYSYTKKAGFSVRCVRD